MIAEIPINIIAEAIEKPILNLFNLRRNRQKKESKPSVNDAYANGAVLQ